MIRVAPWLALVALTVVGCEQVNPITTPTPGAVVQEAAALSQAQRGLDPAAYQKAGFALVERECQLFFDVLDRAQDKALFARQELTLAGGAAAGILAALQAGTVPITVTGIAVPLVADTIGNYRDVILFTPYPDETATLVKDALQTYRGHATAPADIYDAVALVQGYAALCTYSGIHRLAKQALTKATTIDQPLAAPLPLPAPVPPVGVRAAPPPPAPPQYRVHIPNVVVR